MASQPLAVTLQYMRRAPLPGRGAVTRSPEEAVSRGDSFLSTNDTSSHFKLIDDDSRALEEAAIADARRRVLEQRKFSKHRLHLKAWGAPPVSPSSLQRSITPRNRPALKREKVSSSYGNKDADLSLIPDDWKDDDDDEERRPSPVRLRPGEDSRAPAKPVPYDFVKNLKNAKKDQRKRLQQSREAFEGKEPYDDGERDDDERKRESPNHMRKWAEAVRDTYIRDDKRSPSPDRPKTAPKDKRKWKGRVTIPEPFAGLEARATIQRKSMSQIELEKEMQRKEEELEAELKIRFKPVPIPASTTEKRYQSLLDKMEAIRIENHTAAALRLKQNEKPFVGMLQREKEQNDRKKRREEKRLAEEARKKAEVEAQKKAKRLQQERRAAKAVRAAELYQSKEVERKARIARRAEKLMSQASKPARMEKWEMTEGLRKRQEKLERGRSSNAHQTRESSKSKMSAQELRKSFQRSQKRFNEQIQRSKAARPKLKIQPFSFLSDERKEEERLRREKKQAKIKMDVEETKRKQEEKQNRLKKLAAAMKRQKQPITRHTKKSKQKEQLVKQTLSKKVREEEESIRLEEEKNKAMLRTSKEITKELQKRMKEMPSARRTDPKQLAKENEEQMQRRLQKLREDVQRAVDNRVYLFDQHKIQKRKEQARRAALEKVGAAVFNSQDGKNWKNKAKKDKSGLFRDDEKESMDVYDDEDYANDEDFED
jgi:hypothetical protein